MSWTAANIPDQTGRICIVTGANSGIGLSDARILAGKGATVILACRNMDKANAALQSIRSAVPQANVRASVLDLSSLASVREFAARFAGEQDRLDLLLNNAGVMIPPKMETVDGFELQFGTNHLGHFLLTGLLLPLLRKAPGSRVVTVSSIAHSMGRIDFDNLNAEHGYSRMRAYAQSKLANLIFALELQRRLQRSGATVQSLGAHPGATKTDLGRHRFYANLVIKLVAMEADGGAMPTLRAATDPKAMGGEYYGPAGLFAMRGPAVKEKLIARAIDTAVAERLWAISERLTGITYP